MCITFSVPIEKKVKRNSKNVGNTTKATSCKLTAQDLWQSHNNILSTISLKTLIKSNVNTDMMTKTAKQVELNTTILSVTLNTQTSKMI